MPKKAYSYIRFSRPEQMKGDSLRRQLKLSTEYAKENNLILDTTLHLTDLGVSAYSGANVEQGALGAFIKAIEQGKVENGSYLLVESLDRISREKVTKALGLFLSILNKGIIIVTLSDGMKYDIDSLDTSELIVSISIMSRAHNESVTKSIRIKEAWENKFKNASQVKLTKWAPAWLELSKNRTKFNKITERTKVVKDIFKWSAKGLGTILIIRKLGEKGIKPWGKGKGKNKMLTKWHPSYIQKILNNRAVLGEFQPLKSNKKDEMGVIKDYYPKIIHEDLFYKVQEARKSRSVANKGGGRKGKTVSNLFSKIAYCGYSFSNNMGIYKCEGDEELMVYVNKGKKSPAKYLQCVRQKSGNIGCDECRKMLRYDQFEIAFLTHVKDIDASLLLGSPDSLMKEIQALKDTISSARGKLVHIEKQIGKVSDASLNTDGGIPNFLINKGKELEQEQKSLKNNIQQMNKELKSKEYDYENSDRKKEHLENLIDKMSKLSGSNLLDIRIQLSELLKEVIERIEIYTMGRIRSKKYISKIRRELGKEAAEAIKASNKNSDNVVIPFFVINYKAGEQRTIIPEPNNPKNIIATIKWDGEEILEEITKWGVNSQTANSNSYQTKVTRPAK